jgi:hypothetical protein
MKLSDQPASANCLKNDLGPFPAHVVERPI